MKKAETTIKEGGDPDILHKIGYEPPVANANDGGDDAACPLHAGFSLKRCSPPRSADLHQQSPGLFANGIARHRWHIFADQPPDTPTGSMTAASPAFSVRLQKTFPLAFFVVEV